MRRLIVVSLLALAVAALSLPALQAVGQATPAVSTTAQQALPSEAGLKTQVNPKDGLTYVWIPPGKFMFGCSPGDTDCDTDEAKPHEVTIEKGFWIGQTLVTQEAYNKVMGKNPSLYKGATFPVSKVNFYDAKRYCAAVGMRLPSEIEYEYAARAGTTTPRYGDVDAIAWYKANGREPYSGSHPHEVKTKQPNAFGLYDMLGNMWELTGTEYRLFVVTLRGGSYDTSAKNIRASVRGFDQPDDRRKFTSFRCSGESGDGSNAHQLTEEEAGDED